MDRTAVIRAALRALGRNKLRTALTLFGITIGISAVICTVAIGEGGSDRIHEQLLLLGDNFVWVEAGGRNVNGVRTGTGATKSLTLADMKAILQNFPIIKGCSPQVDSRIQVVYGNQNWNTTYRGISPDYFSIRRWSVVEGGAFSQEEVDASANVCLLGQTVASTCSWRKSRWARPSACATFPLRWSGCCNRRGIPPLAPTRTTSS